MAAESSQCLVINQSNSGTESLFSKTNDCSELNHAGIFDVKTYKARNGQKVFGVESGLKKASLPVRHITPRLPLIRKILQPFETYKAYICKKQKQYRTTSKNSFSNGL